MNQWRNKFSTEKNDLFRNAYIELKRIVANQENTMSKSKNYYNSNSYATPRHDLFLDYYTLMCGFKKNGDRDTDNFFKDIYRITDKKFLIEAEIIHHKLGMKVDTSTIDSIANDLEYRIWTYNRLKDENVLKYFPSDITQEEMAYASLYNYGFDSEEDTAVFIKRVKVSDGKKNGYIYFFKSKKENTRNWMVDYTGLQPLNENEFATKKQDYKKGLSVKSEEEIEKTIEKTIEIFEMSNRKRVVLTSYNWGGWGLY